MNKSDDTNKNITFTYFFIDFHLVSTFGHCHEKSFWGKERKNFLEIFKSFFLFRI